MSEVYQSMFPEEILKLTQLFSILIFKIDF